MEKTQFKNLNLSEPLLRAIEDVGFEEATAIQTQTIPLILQGKDVIGHSQTGTGKTAAFGLPALDLMDPTNRNLQVLVMCPTRELAIQACEEIRKFSKYKQGIKALAIYGGQPIERQIRDIKQGVNIIIGTPGRVMDHMRRKTMIMDAIKIVVLDEADEMLNIGFREDIETILKDVPKERQTILFSATMSRDILRLTNLYQKDPELVKVVHKQLTVPSIEQFYLEVANDKRPEVLSRIIDIYNPKLSLVFCNTKKKVDELVTQLQFRGYLVDGIHGDIKQNDRTRVMNNFRSGNIEILVATDVAARGIDVDDVEAVFNYDLPQDEEYYVHRIGRTGRAGRNGRAFSFIAGKKQVYALKDIQRYTNSRIQVMPIPTVGDVEEIKLNNFITEVKNVLENQDLDKYVSFIEKLMENDYTSIDIAAALVKIIMEEDRVSPEKANNERNSMEMDFENTGAEPGMVRMFINIGRIDRIRANDIVGAIAGETGIHGKVIGLIDVYDKYTFVEVPRENAEDVLKAMKNAQIKGKKVNIEPAKSKR